MHYEWACGGNGGFLEADGPSAMAAIDWGDLTTAQSTEVLETQYPLHVEFSQLGTDSGGAGRHRGGLGMRRALRLTRGTAKYSLLADGAIMPPFGILGGESGAPVDSYVVKADGTEHRFDSPGKVGGYPLEAGDTVVLQSAGGGGYGDPLERDPEAVARDVADGVVSLESAGDLYGAATEVQPPSAAACQALTVKDGGNDAYIPSGPSKKRVIALNPADTEALGFNTGDKVELLGKDGAPLRGWVVLDKAVTPGTVPLDAKGHSTLGTKDSDQVQLRCLNTPVIERQTKSL